MFLDCFKREAEADAKSRARIRSALFERERAIAVMRLQDMEMKQLAMNFPTYPLSNYQHSLYSTDTTFIGRAPEIDQKVAENAESKMDDSSASKAEPSSEPLKPNSTEGKFVQPGWVNPSPYPLLNPFPSTSLYSPYSRPAFSTRVDPYTGSLYGSYNPIPMSGPTALHSSNTSAIGPNFYSPLSHQIQYPIPQSQSYSPSFLSPWQYSRPR